MDLRTRLLLRCEPHCVYRLFDAAGRLLYIGCSRRPARRLAEHRATQPWASDVDSHTEEWHDDFWCARRSEHAAIQSEGALYNVPAAEHARRSAETLRRKRAAA